MTGGFDSVNTRPAVYLTLGVLSLFVLVGVQQLIYPLEQDLSYRFIQSFGAKALERPVGLTVANDRIYVADTEHDRIVVFNQDGQQLGAGGRTGSVPGQFRRPMRLASGPDGKIYVTDLLNHRIQVFSPQGNVLKTYGEDGDVELNINQPAGVDVDAQGNLYVVEFMGQRVLRLSPDGTQLASWGVKNTKGYVHYGYFNYPTDVAVAENGEFFVTDTFNDRVKHYGPDGHRLNVWGGFFALNLPGPFRGWFKGAYGVEIARDPQRVFVTDWGNHRVQVFNRNGDFLTSFGSKGRGPGEMNNPTDVATGAGDSLFVADFGNDRIQRWVPMSEDETP